jgi:5-methyltetrahydropteroyltriglutamate--homocysteine methyltransferase
MVYIDDIGSLPFPKRSDITKEKFASLYIEQQEIAAQKGRVESELFYDVIASALWLKIEAGLDVINYPQLYNMYDQFLTAMKNHEVEPFLIEEKYAVIPELFVVKQEARRYYEQKGEKLKLRVCVTGPLELYQRSGFGTYIYEDILRNFALSVNAFLRNALIKDKYIETFAVAIDEPSLGYSNLLNISDEELIKSYELATKGISTAIQIHLHTLNAAKIPLMTENINVLTVESAANPENLKNISKAELEANDKFIRVGVTRTDINAIYAEYLEKGIEPSDLELVDSEDSIRKRFENARKFFGERLSFTGPDCGLGSWPSQQVAFELLKRTVRAIKSARSFQAF